MKLTKAFHPTLLNAWQVLEELEKLLTEEQCQRLLIYPVGTVSLNGFCLTMRSSTEEQGQYRSVVIAGYDRQIRVLAGQWRDTMSVCLLPLTDPDSSPRLQLAQYAVPALAARQAVKWLLDTPVSQTTAAAKIVAPAA